MKKLLVFAAGLFIIGLLSCAEDCKECYIKTYEADGVTVESQGTPSEYCGDNLADVDGKSETDPSGIKTEYVCE